MKPKYPIYIVSKGRWGSRLTSKSLEQMDVPYYIVVEEQEYNNYASVINPHNILILPQEYKDNYDTCDDLGDSKGKGPGAARNFCWEHSILLGAFRHWVMDDNIDGFIRLNHNRKIKVVTGAIFRASEDFVDRYDNVAIAGFNYRFFGGGQRRACGAYILNTRIYSCLLIRNDIPYRWRARYNEDTDLSLRVLKDGWCTIQFNAFMQNKLKTQSLKGGNTAEFYEQEGTLAKSQMQVKLHPDCSKLVWKYNRWHHYVDYSRFKTKLKRKEGLEISDRINNYGMKLVDMEVTDVR